MTPEILVPICVLSYFGIGFVVLGFACYPDRDLWDYMWIVVVWPIILLIATGAAIKDTVSQHTVEDAVNKLKKELHNDTGRTQATTNPHQATPLERPK